MRVIAGASPSLALVKYWGKLPNEVNLPATPSLAITLGELRTVTEVTASTTPEHGDEITIGGALQSPERFAAFLDMFRARAGSDRRVRVDSKNNFPTAAGLASSSSGFAALALALDAYYGTGMTAAELSEAARHGSGSACRAVYGGFTVWRAGARRAEPFAPADHWPELRVVVVVLATAPKPVSSRDGMRMTASTSPVYRSWCAESQAIFDTAVDALTARDLEALGEAMRNSYLYMFSTMFTARPPVIFWLPQSVAIIREAEAMRRDGLPVWETMDAGPQVKLVTTEDKVEAVSERVRAVVPDASLLVCSVGEAPEVRRER